MNLRKNRGVSDGKENFPFGKRTDSGLARAYPLLKFLTGTYFSFFGFQKRSGSDFDRTCHWLCHAVSGRCDRWKKPSQCHGDCKSSFGNKGGQFFAILNVLQLVGWTAIMIYDGALAVDGMVSTGRWLWCLIIGALIVVWILIGITNLGKINTAAMVLFYSDIGFVQSNFFDGNVIQVPQTTVFPLEQRWNLLWQCRFPGFH